MSASQKLRWRKIVNQLRYMHEELGIVQQINEEMGPAFQAHYEDFCKRHRVDIDELNRESAQHRDRAFAEHAEHLSNAAKRETAEYDGSTDMVVYDGDPDAPPPNPEEDVESPTTTSEEREVHEVFAKLFKKLAQKLHPDKVANDPKLTDEEKKEYTALFTKASTALEEQQYFLLIDYAEKLKVPLPKNYKQQIKWMKREIEVLERLITTQMRSYNYMFAERDNIVDKDNLIKQFIYQVFGETIL